MPTSPPARVLLLSTLLTGVVAATGSSVLPADVQVDGGSLAAELGCGACHAGMPDPAQARARAPRFGAGGEPLPADFVFTYLADPQRRRTDIGRTRMPDFGLDEAERVALAGYLGTGDPGDALAEAMIRHPDASDQVGERIFGDLGCGGCHDVDGRVTEPVGPDLSREGARARLEWLESFLVSPVPVRGDGHPARPGARMPDFGLDADEAHALALLLSTQGDAGRWTPQPLTPFQMRRTERLVKDRLACLGCHSLAGGGGAVGPSLDGIGERLHPSFVLAMVSDPQGTAPRSGMPRQHMETREARRVAAYLLQLGGSWKGVEYGSLADSAHPAAVAASARSAPEGERLYLRHCASCHGVSGEGDGFNAGNLPVPPTEHASAALMSRRPDDTLFDGIHAGAYVLDGSGRMPPFGELLTPGQIRSLVAYIRELCDCRGPDWSRNGAAR